MGNQIEGAETQSVLSAFSEALPVRPRTRSGQPEGWFEKSALSAHVVADIGKGRIVLQDLRIKFLPGLEAKPFLDGRRQVRRRVVKVLVVRSTSGAVVLPLR